MNGREISFRDVLGGQTIKVYYYMRYINKIHVLYCKLTVRLFQEILNEGHSIIKGRITAVLS